MNYNFNQNQTVQPQQPQYNSQPRNYQPTSWNSRIRPVSSIDEVRASPIDFDGSVFYFPDMANKKIYTKWINADGTAGLNMYELKEIPNSSTVSSGNYVTREEFEEAIMQLKAFLTPPPVEEQINNPILQF